MIVTGHTPLLSPYRGIKLQETPVKHEYESPTSLLQQQIELSVTGGRGYLSLQDSLDLVNNSRFDIGINDLLEKGVVPLNFKRPIPGKDIRASQYFKNPCEEVSLGLSEKCILPTPTRLPMLHEKVGVVRSIEFRKKLSGHRLY